MRGGDLGNESIDVGGYHIARSFEINHKTPDSILGEKSNWWAELRAVRKHRRKSNRLQGQERQNLTEVEGMEILSWVLKLQTVARIFKLKF